ANTSPMKAAVQAFKLAQGFLIIPIMMAFSGLIWMEGENIEFVISIVLTIGLIVSVAGSIEGRLFAKLPLYSRVLLLLSAFTLLVPYNFINIVVVIIILIVAFVNYKHAKANGEEQYKENTHQQYQKS
ncbi:MAG: TRAP-type uncharacterized transport system fused permease subunit, partial [Paraglaciecola sp.]